MPPGVNTHYSMRSATLGGLNKKDYIEELTKQLDVCQKVQQQRFQVSTQRDPNDGMYIAGF